MGIPVSLFLLKKYLSTTYQHRVNVDNLLTTGGRGVQNLESMGHPYSSQNRNSKSQNRNFKKYLQEVQIGLNLLSAK